MSLNLTSLYATRSMGVSDTNKTDNTILTPNKIQSGSGGKSFGQFQGREKIKTAGFVVTEWY